MADTEMAASGVPAILARLETRPGGLSDAEAAFRRGSLGRNVVALDPSASLARRILRRFRNPLILVLAAAAVVAVFTGDPGTSAIIAVILGLSLAIDGIQEHRATRAVERLRRSVEMTETVIRDGAERRLPSTDIVPGDIVVLAAGDLVPADGRVLEARDFFVNESLLTGESLPLEKKAEAPARTEAQENLVFMGASVVAGWAKMVVCRTGAGTTVGQIGSRLADAAPPGALERATQRFGVMVIRLSLILVLFVLLVNVLVKGDLLQGFLFALALAVGLTPELLPMITTVTLASGAMRMARQRVVVKRLAAIHDLGAMDVLCTDKTGTLTEAVMKLAASVNIDGAASRRVVELAWLNSRFESGLRSPFDQAVLAAQQGPPGAWSKVDELPFDFERRRVAVLVTDGRRRIEVVKGAPEDVLGLSSSFLDAGEAAVAFDDEARARAAGRFHALAAEGFRVLAVAYRDIPVGVDRLTRDSEKGLTFAGYIAFEDPPKETAAQAIATLRQAGIALKVLTGDNEHVTRHLCRAVGIPEPSLLTGPEIAALSEEALTARAAATTVFCRVTPAQKHRIILALRRGGRVVGYLGDGINDAPALHAADAGISVQDAVDVAKEAADIVLLDKDLGVLARGVAEGRRTFANIMKYVMMVSSSNFGNMLSMAAAAVFLPFLPMTPVQVLLNNLLYDVSEIAIPADRIDSDLTAAPRHWDMAFIRNFMLVMGGVSSLFDGLTFALLLFVFRAGETVFHTAWFVESLVTQVLVVLVIRTRGNPFRSRPAPPLIGAALAVAALAVLLPYSPAAVWFGFTPLPSYLLLGIAALTAAYLMLAQAAKVVFYRIAIPAPAWP